MKKTLVLFGLGFFLGVVLFAANYLKPGKVTPKSDVLSAEKVIPSVGEIQPGQPKILPKIKTVFVVVMENTNWASVLGNPDAAYLNSLIKRPDASYSNQYYNPPGVE